MSTPTSIPYDWIREIPSALKLLDDIPLLGYPPKFPIEDFAAKLGQLLQIPNLSLSLSVPELCAAQDLLKGLPEDLMPINFVIPPVEGSLCLLFSKQDVTALFANMISASPNTVLDKEYLEGFYNFIALEAIGLFQGVDFDKNLAPQMLASKELPAEPSLCWEITLNTPNRKVHGRLIAGQMFRAKWKERYSHRSLTVPPALTQQVEVTVHVEAGHTTMSLNEWRGVAPGDFIILDQCSIIPEENKGRVMLTLNGKPTFRARLKQGALKILEYPMFYEVETPMAKFTPEEGEEEVEETEEDEELEDSEIDEEEVDESVEEGVDEEVEEEDEVDEEEEEIEGEATAPGRPALQPTGPGHSTETRSAPSPEEIPVTLVVEVGRFQITVQKLMELQPGNLLELDVRPENGIDLVINGKCIGKGELLRIGETLGVRILDMVT